MRRKFTLPCRSDIEEAVREASIRAYDVHPHEFPEIVYEILERKGFRTDKVSIKRIWETYERLVKKGVIADVLNVVKN